MTTRKNRKYFVIFNNGGVISATTPKDWARAHQNLFPKKTFEDAESTPTVDQIVALLQKKFEFRVIENHEVVICYAYKSI